MYRTSAHASWEDYEAAVAALREAFGALREDDEADPAIAAVEAASLAPLALSPQADADALDGAVALLRRLAEELAVARIRHDEAWADHLPDGYPPFVPPPRPFLATLLRSFVAGAVDRVADTRVTLGRKWGLTVEGSEVFAGEEAWFRLAAPPGIYGPEPLQVLLHARCSSRAAGPIHLERARLMTRVRPGLPSVRGRAAGPFDRERSEVDGRFQALVHLAPEEAAPLRAVFSAEVRRAVVALLPFSGFEVAVGGGFAHVRLDDAPLLEAMAPALTLLGALRALRAPPENRRQEVEPAPRSE